MYVNDRNKYIYLATIEDVSTGGIYPFLMSMLTYIDVV
jgi:hypothetical protein